MIKLRTLFSITCFIIFFACVFISRAYAGGAWPPLVYSADLPADQPVHPNQEIHVTIQGSAPEAFNLQVTLGAFEITQASSPFTLIDNGNVADFGQFPNGYYIVTATLVNRFECADPQPAVAIGTTAIYSSTANQISKTLSWQVSCEPEPEPTPTPEPTIQPEPNPTPQPINPNPGKGSALHFDREVKCEEKSFAVAYTAREDSQPREGVEVKFTYNNNEKISHTDSGGVAHVTFDFQVEGSVKATANGYPDQSLHISDVTDCPDLALDPDTQVLGASTDNSAETNTAKPQKLANTGTFPVNLVRIFAGALFGPITQLK